ncbi:DNA replication/repair protein RecF [Subtercola boreus]|uniref:DNA replication and repair protein RecF n=1 Tax=Subtercola boreus TaxID=120213 RepID=A0A3E0WFZ5_9MICO|nr:DNA replication/repair protein RecF [Subtercola boreus]RFA23447.1 DNA replication/repair protein RecF [Subtercola boreus]RFA23840.1 DNA replication/repair protein RecF [Subtercola boreus]RFA29541.1 DNA replication/repair protein RecF [Subtercola boreus]
MLVRHLSLTDFRNYPVAEVELSAGPNLFVGSNGQGKTNLVEALGYLSTLGSHRVSSDQALIRSGQQSAVIRARLEHAGREILVEVQINRSEANRAQVNRSVTKVREIPRFFSSVLFAPEDLALVRGDPSGRRRFIDQLLFARSPRLAGVASDYDRVLRQRNTLLKSVRSSGVKGNQLSTLEIWDDRLITLGAEIITERDALVALLRPHVEAAYRAVAGSDHSPKLTSRLSILSPAPTDDDLDDQTAASSISLGSPFRRESVEAQFRAAVAGVRRQELERGITLCGPHRDDIVFELNGLPAKGYASHGESWSFALALKIASADLLRADSSTGDPVVILDDVFAELDKARRTRLAAAVADYEQVLITAAVFGDVPVELTARTVHIAAGTIVGEPTDA